MRRIDLHSHSDQSDGTETPEEVMRLAADAGLDAIALTDHDTTTGLAAARDAAQRHGLELITGCEVSTRLGSKSVHILAYGFREQDPSLQALLARIRDDRTRRNALMLEKLASFDMPLTIEEVERHAAGEIVARPHFVEAMLDRGYVKERQDAYERWIGDDGPAYAIVEMPSPAEAIEAIRLAGGASVLAHPRQLRLDASGEIREVVQAMAEAGLDGLEVQHPSQKPQHRKRYRKLAEALDLVATGGSDFHGAHKPHIAIGVGDGTIDVTRETWERLRERTGKQRP